MKQYGMALLLTLLILVRSGPEDRPGFESCSDQRLRTFMGTSVGGWLQVPEELGEERYFTLTAEPVKGKLVLSEDGSFVYSPREGKLGEDSFYYQVVDGKGHVGPEACVRIQIQRQEGGAVYDDMRDRPEAYAAALLSRAGLFTGEQVVGQACFCPEKPVTRGEFLSICLALSGRPILQAVSSTGLADDEAIPAWMKSYVMSAALSGLNAWGEDAFAPSEPITRGEASRMSEQSLGLLVEGPLAPEASLDRAAMALLLQPLLDR